MDHNEAYKRLLREGFTSQQLDRSSSFSETLERTMRHLIVLGAGLTTLCRSSSMVECTVGDSQSHNICMRSHHSMLSMERWYQRGYPLKKPHQIDYQGHHDKFSAICCVPIVKCFYCSVTSM